MDELEHKYKVEIKKSTKPQKLSKSTKEDLKSCDMINEKGKIKITGISNKILKVMKQEFVTCPVLKRDVHFIQCFICPNFQSRIMGKVLCKGESLSVTKN
ncbi:MAG: hypothetical protein OXF28_00995 [Thaumarchaeota archaeon]|nr:hypothetical protein [Nitrososphaerota archaeon]